jgi:hypothetical protein
MADAFSSWYFDGKQNDRKNVPDSVPYSTTQKFNAFVSLIGANVTVVDTSGWPWQSNYNPTCNVSAGGWC